MSVFAPAACPCCAPPNPCACPPDSPWTGAIDGDLYTARFSIEGIAPSLADPPPLSWGMFNLNPDTVGEGGWLWYDGAEDPVEYFADQFNAAHPVPTDTRDAEYADAWCAEIKPQYLDQGGRQWSGVGGPDLDGIEMRMTNPFDSTIACLHANQAKCNGLGWGFRTGWRPGLTNGPNAIPNTPGDIDESKSKVNVSFDINFIPNAYNDTIDYVASGITSTVLTFRIPSRPWTDYFFLRYGHKYDFVDVDGDGRFHGYPDDYDPHRNYGPATYTASYSIGWFFSTGTIKHADLCNQSSITIINKVREGKNYDDKYLYRLCQHFAPPDPDHSSGSSASYFPPDSSSSESEGIGQQDGDWPYGPLWQINGAGSVTISLETCPTDRDLSSASSASSSSRSSSSSSSSSIDSSSSSSRSSSSVSGSDSRSDGNPDGSDGPEGSESNGNPFNSHSSHSSHSSESRSSVSIDDSHSSQTLFVDESSASSNPYAGDSFSEPFGPDWSSASSPSSPSSLSSVVDISSPSSQSSHSSQSSSSSSTDNACPYLIVASPCGDYPSITLYPTGTGSYAGRSASTGDPDDYVNASISLDAAAGEYVLRFDENGAYRNYDPSIEARRAASSGVSGSYTVVWQDPDDRCAASTINVTCVGSGDDNSSSSSSSSSSDATACPCSSVTIYACPDLPTITATANASSPCSYNGGAGGGLVASIYFDTSADVWRCTYESYIAGPWQLVGTRSASSGPIGTYTVPDPDGDAPCQPSTLVVTCAGADDNSSSSSASSHSSQSGADNSSSSSSSSGICRMTGACAGGVFNPDAPLALDESTLSTRCKIFRDTCIDIGTGDHGHFAEHGRDYLWHTTTGTPTASLAPDACNCPDAPNQYVIVTRVFAYIDD